MPSIFVSAWVGAGNLGDELLFARLQAHLRAAGADDITVTSLDPAGTRALHGTDAIHPRDLIGTIRHVRRSDLVIVGPGGLLQDRSSPFNLPYQLHRAALARLTRTPVLGIGLGADPMNRLGSGALLRLALGGAHAIAVRDEASQQALAAHRVNAVTTTDLAAATPSPPATDGSATLIVSLRPWRQGGRLPVRWQSHNLAPKQIEATAHALDTIADTTGLAVRFVAFEPHTDHPLHEAVAAAMSEPASCCVPELHELLDLVADSRAVIATRFHAGIVALVTGRPLALIGYAPKVTSLATATGAPIVADDEAGLKQLPGALTDALAIGSEASANALAEMRTLDLSHADLIERALQG